MLISVAVLVMPVTVVVVTGGVKLLQTRVRNAGMAPNPFTWRRTSGATTTSTVPTLYRKSKPTVPWVADSTTHGTPSTAVLLPAHGNETSGMSGNMSRRSSSKLSKGFVILLTSGCMVSSMLQVGCG